MSEEVALAAEAWPHLRRILCYAPSRLLGVAFALGLVGIGAGFGGYALGWRWLRIVGFSLGVLALALGLVSVLMRLCAKHMGWSPWHQLMVDYGVIPAPEFF